MDPVYNSQNNSPASGTVVDPPQKAQGFFKNVGGIAKRVVAPLGVEVGIEEKPPLVVNAPEPIPAQAPGNVDVVETSQFSNIESPDPEFEVNILNDTVFKENPAEYLKIGDDGKTHLDFDKLKKDANRYLMDPQNLKKIIYSNPHLSTELKEAGIKVPSIQSEEQNTY